MALWALKFSMQGSHFLSNWIIELIVYQWTGQALKRTISEGIFSYRNQKWGWTEESMICMQKIQNETVWRVGFSAILAEMTEQYYSIFDTLDPLMTLQPREVIVYNVELGQKTFCSVKNGPDCHFGHAKQNRMNRVTHFFRWNSKVPLSIDLRKGQDDWIASNRILSQIAFQVLHFLREINCLGPATLLHPTLPTPAPLVQVQ